ncbi:hypothetical protein [Methanobrevibacter sp. V74]|uniref:hypothetical protein n=1 Tax=Methanobrevibacter sp. V74 TaxID=3064279 RepID=UPI0027370C5E|nr:hypothetical protein [Methanobrevibacter sp. V74]
MTSPITITHGDNEVIQFEVRSSSNPETYMVTWDIDNHWLCDCPGCMLGRHLCKHILQCIDYMKFITMTLLDDPIVFKGVGL